MAHIVAVLDMDLPLLRDWVKRNIQPGFEPRFLSAAAPDFHSRLAEADSLVLFESPIPAEAIAAAPRLKLIQLPQVGYDNVDAKAAARAGVPVCNTPGLTATSVAEHTLMLILAVERRLLECDARVRRSEWPQLEMFEKGLHDFSGAALGIVGFGAIGQALARICRPLAGEILYTRRDRLPVEEERALGVFYAPLEELMRRSDVVSVHAPLNDSTRGLIGAKELALMKPTAILVNTARGAVVDHDALVERLQSGKLRGAAFDVLWQEPPPPGSPLLSMENVVFTPHIASSTQDMAFLALSAAFENVYRVAAGEAPRHPVAEARALTGQTS